MARRKAKKTKASRVGKHGRDRNDPADWQERHSPTVPVIIGVNGKRTETSVRRRREDAELVMDLDPAQIQAAEELRDAYFAVIGDVAVRGAQYGERVDTTYRGADAKLPDSDRTTHHAAWAWLCKGQEKPIDVDAVHEVICEGYACRTVDRARGRAGSKGEWSAGHVKRGLDLWDEARPRRRPSAGSRRIANRRQALSKAG